MRKILILLIASVSSSNAYSQPNFSLATSGNFSFLVGGFGTNNGGIGFTVHSNLFSKKKLQLRTEVSLDHFLGSKLLMIDSLGNYYDDNPTMISAKAGPEFTITDKISVAALYGYCQFKSFNDKTHSGNFKFILTAHTPKHPKMLIGFQFTKLTGGPDVYFFGINVGWKIL